MFGSRSRDNFCNSVAASEQNCIEYDSQWNGYTEIAAPYELTVIPLKVKQLSNQDIYPATSMIRRQEYSLLWFREWHR
jgi:hypothetical protein